MNVSRRESIFLLLFAALSLFPAAGVWAQEKSVQELEVSFKSLFGQGSFDGVDHTYSLDSAGFGIEVRPGFEILSGPVMDFGIVYGFFMLSGSTNVDETPEGSPDTTYAWKASAVSFSTYAKAKYSFNFNFNPFQLNLHNGMGLGYAITSLDAKAVNTENEDNTLDKGETEYQWRPLIDFGIGLTYAVSEYSRLGLIVDAMLAPLEAGDYQNILTTGVGLDFKVTY